MYSSYFFVLITFIFLFSPHLLIYTVSYFLFCARKILRFPDNFAPPKILRPGLPRAPTLRLGWQPRLNQLPTCCTHLLLLSLTSSSSSSSTAISPPPSNAVPPSCDSRAARKEADIWVGRGGGVLKIQNRDNDDKLVVPDNLTRRSSVDKYVVDRP